MTVETRQAGPGFPVRIDGTVAPGVEIGRSRPIRSLIDWVDRVAGCSLPVLIRGESGAGKESIARRVHAQSPRRDGPFVAVNCAALPETLLEAELFGSSRGSYTGADRDRPGLFRAASGGTLFLDEIGDMPPAMQAKLLRAIEERSIRPVGSSGELDVDVRVISATHRNVRALVDCRRFRADLYYRLAVVEVVVPPLRERIDDLPLLVRALAARLADETHQPPPELSRGAWLRLAQYDWPGNVRELHAVLARATLRASGATIEVHHLEELALDGETTATSEREPENLERTMIAAALVDGGSVAEAARRIGWTRQKLYRRMRALGVRADALGSQP